MGGAIALHPGRNLSDLRDVAAAQMNLGLVPGILAHDIVQLDGSAKLPAVDGSQLTNITLSQIGGEGALAALGVGSGLVSAGGLLNIDTTHTNVWSVTQTVNLNAHSAPAASTGTGMQVVGADGTLARVETDAFGANAAVTLRRADGTGASPTAIQSGDVIGAFNWHGYTGAAYSNAQASIEGVAAENWTSSHNGSQVVILTTPNGSTTLTQAAVFGQDQSFQLNGNAFLSSPAAGRMQHGQADAASPVAQIIGVQNVVAGTANTPGQTVTYRSSAGTGNAVSTGFAWATSDAHSSDTVQQSFSNKMTLSGVGNLTLQANSGQGQTYFQLTSADGTTEGQLNAVNGGNGVQFGSVTNHPFYLYTNNVSHWVFTVNGLLNQISTGVIGWASGGLNQTAQTSISQTAAATIAVGNGTQGDASGTILAGKLKLADNAGNSGNYSIVSSGTPGSGINFNGGDVALFVGGSAGIGTTAAGQATVYQSSGLRLLGGGPVWLSATAANTVAVGNAAGDASGTIKAAIGTFGGHSIGDGGGSLTLGIGSAAAVVTAAGAQFFSTSHVTVGYGATRGAASLYFGIQDTGWNNPALGSIQQGGPDSATPVAQTYRFQSVTGAAANTPAPNSTITASLGLGNDNTGGQIQVQVGAIGASGTTQQTATTALTIANTGLVIPAPAASLFGSNGSLQLHNNVSGTIYPALKITSGGSTSVASYGNGGIGNGGCFYQSSSLIDFLVVGAGNYTVSNGGSYFSNQSLSVFGQPSTSAQTASTEAPVCQFGGLAGLTTTSKKWATGALTTQRAFVFLPETLNFNAASTVTNAATVAIQGPPVAGSNATVSNPYSLWVQSGASLFGGAATFSGNLTLSAVNIVTDTTTGMQIGTATNQKIGFLGKTPVVQQTDGAGLTNNIVASGTTNQLDDFTSLTIYATDAQAIHNSIYQLGRKLKIVDDALRLYGLLS